MFDKFLNTIQAWDEVITQPIKEKVFLNSFSNLILNQG